MKTVPGFNLRTLCKEYILTAENVTRIDFNRMISLNESAAYLWEQVDGKGDFDAKRLAELLCERYEVDEETALHDSEAIIAKWLEAGIITE